MNVISKYMGERWRKSDKYMQQGEASIITYKAHIFTAIFTCKLDAFWKIWFTVLENSHHT